MTIIASVSTLDETQNGYIVALFSQDYTKTMDIRVSKEKLSRMKLSKKYRFMNFTDMPGKYLNAEFVQTEKELEK